MDAGQPTERRIRNLRELRLHDTSDVNFGMNPATVADGSKSEFALSAVGDRIEEIFRFAAKAKSLPDSFHKEFARVKALFDSFEMPKAEQPSRAEQTSSLTELMAELSQLELAL